MRDVVPAPGDRSWRESSGAPTAISRVPSGAPDRLLTDYRLMQRDYLLRITRAMNARRSLPDVLQLVIRSAVRMTNGEAGAIAMQPAGGGDLQIVASFRLEGRFEHDLEAVVDGTAYEPHRSPPSTGNRREPTDGGDDDSYDMLTLPLEVADEIVGQILVFRTEGAAAFTPLDSEVLQAFADQAAVAVRNAYLHDQLAARERQLSEVVERNPGGIVLAGADGRVLAMNPASHALVGLRREDTAGQPLVDVLALEDDAGVPLSLRLPAAGRTTSTRGHLRRPDGARGAFVQVAVRGLCGPGETLDSYLADVVDLSAYKEAEDAKTAFLAGLSHELKTPLALIQGYAETLHLRAARDDPTVFDESVSVILAESAHLNRMVDELLLAARLQSGALHLDFDLVDISEILVRLVDAFRVTHPDRVWSFERSGDLPPLTADPTRLRQVFQNLLSNAAKYTTRGAHISVSARPHPEGVFVTVVDDGIGIAPEDQTRVFDRFVRATDQVEGTGLGLWMSRAIVDAHGGTIDVESEPGRGSAFTVFLPLVANARPVSRGLGETETVVGCGDRATEEEA